VLTAVLSVAALVAVTMMAAPVAGAATATCEGIAAKVRGAKVIRGGPGADVLIGTGRSQTIFGGGGDDRICAGGGNDVVHGDKGNDTIHGGGRGDTLFGERGSDRLYGDVLDDKLFGGPGADALIGGHGVDRLVGGAGNDLLRGGVNRDCLDGGGGVNTGSFATATPPGPQPDIAGVRVDLGQPARAPGCFRGTGSAEGDGNDTTDAEPLRNIQFVVGSAFSDEIHGRAGTSVDAGLGDDSCTGFAQGMKAGCGGGEEKPTGAFAYVFESVTGAPPDPGLIVRAGDGAAADTIGLSGAGRGVAVKLAGETLAMGAGCTAAGCAPAAGSLGYVLVYGGDGADTVSIGEGLSPDTTVDVDGGPGSDRLSGGPLGEVLLGGDSPGSDTIEGNAGDDAVIGGGGPTSGPDLLSGGPGDDQLAADHPCDGDSFSGGPGNDVAGFAPSPVGIRARLGGLATLASGSCPVGSPSSISLDDEVLEGSNEGDRLVGSNSPDTIWGREGGDVIVGNSGADDLEGFAGRDLIDARDGQRDRLIDCGSGRDRARLDRIDPPAIKC
jgi:RTX calcium-binding nonapeptide repeat (4 copies)